MLLLANGQRRPHLHPNDFHAITRPTDYVPIVLALRWQVLAEDAYQWHREGATGWVKVDSVSVWL